jgi:glutathione S-transferase
MPQLTLYHAAPSRSSVVHWMLEEVGEPYDLHLMSLKKGDNRAADYLEVNPMGKVPALRHGDIVITESAAICAYLADAFPQAKLNVPVGDPRRGPYLKWLFFGPSCVEPAIIDRLFPRTGDIPRAKLNVPIGNPRRGIYLKWLFFGPSCVEPAITERAYPRKDTPPRAALGFGDFDAVVDVLAKATTAAQPYLMGEQFTAADVVIGSGLRWGMMFKLLPERPEFASYVGRLSERPALKRATAKDAELQRQQEAA